MSVAGTVLAGAIGGLLAAFVTVVGLILTTSWKIAEENIIKERARWRDAVTSSCHCDRRLRCDPQ